MPKLLQVPGHQGWPHFQRLLVALLRLLEPYLRNAELTEAVRFLYKGTLRVLLVLLHDFPEFLCEYHFPLCDVVPPSCIQMRNLILSAFPRNMRLPDPFTPNLKVDLLPEISQAPRFLPQPSQLLPPALRSVPALSIPMALPSPWLGSMLHSCLRHNLLCLKFSLSMQVSGNINTASSCTQMLCQGDMLLEDVLSAFLICLLCYGAQPHLLNGRISGCVFLSS